MRNRLTRPAALLLATALLPALALAQPSRNGTASPIHVAADAASLQSLLTRVPETQAFPPDFTETLASAASVSMIEMTTSPSCVPCADLWSKLSEFRSRYHWQIRTISGQEALLRSGRLGLPWVGHPVAWVRPIADPDRTIPIAIGTDHLSNLSRNAYLATKMLSGVKPGIALRGMARYTGIVGTMGPKPGPRR
ncbi:hypothetical protein [Novosphingobium rosa]|uniref:hypothetical protein n=1 Tax=Novosphingobium rosa TaxID=76978 RepID=UPI000832F3C9|nr:hypothetical protein [Novosphingobium rosa]